MEGNRTGLARGSWPLPRSPMSARLPTLFLVVLAVVVLGLPSSIVPATHATVVGSPAARLSLGDGEPSTPPVAATPLPTETSSSSTSHFFSTERPSSSSLDAASANPEPAVSSPSTKVQTPAELTQAAESLLPSPAPSASPPLAASSWATPAALAPLSLQIPATAGAGAWAQLCSSCGPTARIGAMMAYDPSDGYVVLYGGYTTGSTATYLADTWTYADGTWTELTGTAPPARAFGSFAWDEADHELVLFGGVNSIGVELGDTWTFSGGTWAQDTTSTYNPDARFASMMTYDTADGYLMMYGGYTSASGGPGTYDGTGYFNDLWEFKDYQWTQETVTGPSGVPPPMYGASMVYDAYDGYVVMFGGVENGGTGYMADTWEYNGGDWYDITGSTAPPVWNCGSFLCEEEMAYDAVDHEVVYATDTSSGNEETWLFQSGTWADTTSTSGAVPVGLDEAYAWDGADGYVLDFSGYSLPNTAWIYPGPMSASVDPNQPGVDAGQTLTLTADIQGGVPPYSNYNWGSLPNGCTNAVQATITCQPNTPGTSSVTVSATDNGGRHVTSASTSITVSPALTITTPSGSKPSSDVNEPISFSTSVSGGPQTYEIYSWPHLPTGCSSANTSTLPCTPSSPGTYSVQADVTDGNHNPLTSTAISYVVLANPSVTLAENRTVLDIGQSITFWANASGGSGVYSYWFQGLPCATANLSVLACTPSTTGTFSIDVSINDTVGGTATSGSVYFGVKADPTLSTSWTQGSPADYANATLTLDLTYGSGNPSYHPCLDSPGSDVGGLICGVWQGGSSYSFGFWFTSAGSYAVTASVEDSTGWNTTQIIPVNVYWPLAPIQGSLTSVLDQGMTANATAVAIHGIPSFHVWWNLSGNLCTATQYSDGASYCPFVPGWLGFQTITVTLRDSMGDSWGTQYTLSVNSALHGLGMNATAGSFSAGQNGHLQDEIGVSTHLQGSYLGGSGAYSVSWTYNGSLAIGTTPSVVFVWHHGGTYVVTFQVTDAFGESLSGTLTVQVNPGVWNQVFSAHFAEVDVGVPENLSLNFSGGVGPFTYLWTFGGGHSSVNTAVPWVAVAFTAPGTYQLDVTVTDALLMQPPWSMPLTVLADPSVNSLTASSVSSSVHAGETLATYVNASVDLAGLLSGGTMPYQLSWAANGTLLGSVDGEGPWFNVSYIWRTTGLFVLTFAVMDAEGQTATGSVQVLIRADQINPLRVTFPYFPTVDAGVSENLTVSFVGGVGPFTYNWIMGDGHGYQKNDPWLVYSWATPGTYDLSLKVQDSLGASANLGVSITVDPALEASCAPIARPGSIFQFELVNFTLGCIKNGTAPYTELWEFSGALGVSLVANSSLVLETDVLPTGNYSLQVLVNDSAGGSVESRAFHFDLLSSAEVAPWVVNVTYSVLSDSPSGDSLDIHFDLDILVDNNYGTITGWYLNPGDLVSARPWSGPVQSLWVNASATDCSFVTTIEVDNSLGQTSQPYNFLLGFCSLFATPPPPAGGPFGGLSLGQEFLLFVGLVVLALVLVVLIVGVSRRKKREGRLAPRGSTFDPADPVLASLLEEVKANPDIGRSALVEAVHTATGASEDTILTKLPTLVSAHAIVETFRENEQTYALSGVVPRAFPASARAAPIPDPVAEESRLNRIYDTLVDEVAKRGETRVGDLTGTAKALAIDPATLPSILGELVTGHGLLTCRTDPADGTVVYSLSDKERKDRTSRARRVTPSAFVDESAAGEIRPVASGSADLADLR